MNAVIETGGQQFTVEKGDQILVDLLPSEVGSEIRFERVLMVSAEDKTSIGKPTIEGAAVTGKILAQVKGEKVRTFFFRRRKDSRTVKGHRQKYHKVEITGIEGA